MTVNCSTQFLSSSVDVREAVAVLTLGSEVTEEHGCEQLAYSCNLIVT